MIALHHSCDQAIGQWIVDTGVTVMEALSDVSEIRILDFHEIRFLNPFFNHHHHPPLYHSSSSSLHSKNSRLSYTALTSSHRFAMIDDEKILNEGCREHL
ncbi:hypothetical protein PM082_010884 [Marasmius tenuissimus]|nr:hypothetical protein PM082_010884 [Marasmius tenuissimus]